MFDNIDHLQPICDELHQEGKKIVLATGFFDLLHQEHQEFLKKASTAGDILVVAVESDARARQIKGEGRPLQTQSVRCQQIINFFTKMPDYPIKRLLVLALSPDFNNPSAYEHLMAVIRPNIYAVSSHTSHLDNKAQLTQKFGGQLVVVHDHNPHISTTQLISAPKDQL